MHLLEKIAFYEGYYKASGFEGCLCKDPEYGKILHSRISSVGLVLIE